MALLLPGGAARLCRAAPGRAAPLAVVMEVEGRAEFQRAGTADPDAWDPAYANQALNAGDRVRTHAQGRIALLLHDQSVVRFPELSSFILEAPREAGQLAGFNLLRGRLYFFHRDKPAALRVRTRTASAAVRGTEFHVEAEEDGQTILTVLEGEVELSSDQGTLLLQSGEQGTVKPGQAPVKTAVVYALNVIQWALYYPAILDLQELTWPDPGIAGLEASRAAYGRGDLLQALADYPSDRVPESWAERLYHSALLLAVGQVEATESLLAQAVAAADTRPAEAGRAAALAAAFRQLIGAVKGLSFERTAAPVLATEWLAESYYRQSRSDLPGALQAARRAVAVSPECGFAWARVAELEFSFGRVPAASEALETGLRLAPRNPQAHALQGFLLAARNRIPAALEEFEQAIGIDGALANAWLGRGLCRLKQGDRAAGRADLLVAAALEPQRAILRSYLGKAYAAAGDHVRAAKELALAQQMDPADPTAWLYSALWRQQHREINDAIRDLEQSQALNDNRRLYRSRLLLDQDRAVRAANLALLYQDAGLQEVSVREASYAVHADYANYSAHLFLAESYEALRDPKLINLRYETPANSEYLLANLLAPVGAGPVSSAISQQEYSRLFERDGLGVVSSTEYYSSGDWVQRGAQYGVFGNFGYALDAFYRTENGQRPNNDLEQMQLALQLKVQATPQDSFYLQGIYSDIESGDLFQYYDQTSASPSARVTEEQAPILVLGYHHEWRPGAHTLFLGGWLNDTFTLTNQWHPTLLTLTIEEEMRTARGLTMHEYLRIKPEIYSAELQQLFQGPNHTTIFGGRYQSGQFNTRNRQSHPLSCCAPVFEDPPADQEVEPDYERASVYVYHHWQVIDSLRLIAGLSYDCIEYPENFRLAPVSAAENTIDQLSPKAGVIWQPLPGTTFRGAYTRSLASASLEQSFQLEPTQVAGFLQSFRSIMPESVAGANAGPRFETGGLAWEQRCRHNTYLGIGGEILISELRRTVGAFDWRSRELDFAVPAGLPEDLDYHERALWATAHQLISRDWTLGLQYRLTAADLDDVFVTVPDTALLIDFKAEQHVESVLHQVRASAGYHPPCGFFARAEAWWQQQRNQGYQPDLPGDDFWQFHAFVGYRFPQRRAELLVGLLNLTDQDYRLNPLTLYQELPRERTFMARLRFSF